MGAKAKRRFAKICAAFDMEEPPFSPFHHFEFALRFELGGEVYGNIERPITRFLQAHARACAVAAHVFAETKTITLCLAHIAADRPRSIFKRPFVATGLRVEEIRNAGAVLIEDEDAVDENGDPLSRHWSLVTFTDKRLLPELLWLALSHEMPILPSAQWLELYFVDLQRRVMIYPYDDRGMDVAAMDRATLQSTHDAFTPWLLDFSREKMDRVFGSDSQVVG